MRKTLQFLLLLIFCLPMLTSMAQNKYAIVVGINNYYNSPTQLSQFCLKGCVNDAKSIQSLLINRFGFDKKNIVALLNENATQNNLLDTCKALLNKCKPGDALMFYYCGHGIWMYNNANDNDSVKDGFNQAICMSNLYAPNYGCLVKDNTLKKIFNQFIDKHVVVTSIFDCCFSGNLSMDMLEYTHNNYYDPQTFQGFTPKSLYFESIEYLSRSFNPSVTLTINDAEKVVRPSERKDSRFLSISACADNEVAMEVYDEANNTHGALTKALLSVYKHHASNFPLSKVFDEIKNTLNKEQLFMQQPTYHLDSSRIGNNLIGIASNNFSNTITTTCIDKIKDTLVMNTGANDGLMKGNLLTATNGTQIKVTQVYEDSAKAMVTKGASSIKRNDRFTLTDDYTSSEPLLNIYIPQSRYSSTVISHFFNQKILPFTKDKRYRDYNNWDIGMLALTLVMNDTAMTQQYTTLLKEQPLFFIFLPMPADVAVAIKKELGKNQNVQLVSSEKDADYVLYLNYVNATDNSKAGFVFTYSPAIKLDVAPVNNNFFYVYHTQIPALSFTQTSLSNLAKQVNSITQPALRATGTHWLNEDAKR